MTIKMNSINTKIEKLGLTMSETKIYLAVLVLGKTTISQIAKQTSINRRNIYDSLSTLIDKGLIFQIIGEKEGRYVAIEPSKLQELIQSKELALKNIMPDLEKAFNKNKTRDQAYIYKGIEGFKNYLEDVLQIGKDVYCVGAKGGWGYQVLGEFADWFETERINKKIKVYNLFDHEMRDTVIKNKPSYNKYSEFRFLPPELSTNSAIDIFGNRIVTFTGLSFEKFDDDVTLFVLTNQELADANRAWFQFMWDNSSDEIIL